MNVVDEAVRNTELICVKFYLKAIEDYPIDMVTDMMKKTIERLEKDGSQE
jgi:hypothetical protein